MQSFYLQILIQCWQVFKNISEYGPNKIKSILQIIIAVLNTNIKSKQNLRVCACVCVRARTQASACVRVYLCVFQSIKSGTLYLGTSKFRL